ncbi:unnamed protein product [Hymenolepis diminuta]|uniref:LINE-1 retrotransposable element ORF2 protein n=1 Tax=Hymenolepis diminuta TaxID=6216 RepID=A0A0R3S8A1_HYMDI|nr:unnamed protein product [Hymenolepis diminuta]VUZ56455.1 unnamed protein product [Hymenolepis diminuta]
MKAVGRCPSQFKWMDSKFYKIQFPDGFDGNLTIRKEVWEYFSERVHSIRQIRAQLENCKSPKSSSTFENILKKQVVNSKILVDDFMLMNFDNGAILEQHITADMWKGYTIKSFISPLPNYIFSEVVKGRGSLPNNCCIIYFIKSIRNFKKHVKEIVNKMKSGQVLIFALVKTLQCEQECVNSMDYMCEFVGHISSFLDSLDVNWCIWYVERERDRYVNLSGMYEWACSEVLLSMDSWREKTAMLSPVNGNCQTNGY